MSHKNVIISINLLFRYFNSKIPQQESNINKLSSCIDLYDKIFLTGNEFGINLIKDFNFVLNQCNKSNFINNQYCITNSKELDPKFLQRNLGNIEDIDKNNLNNNILIVDDNIIINHYVDNSFKYYIDEITKNT